MGESATTRTVKASEPVFAKLVHELVAAAWRPFEQARDDPHHPPHVLCTLQWVHHNQRPYDHVSTSTATEQHIHNEAQRLAGTLALARLQLVTGVCRPPWQR